MLTYRLVWVSHRLVQITAQAVFHIDTHCLIFVFHPFYTHAFIHSRCFHIMCSHAKLIKALICSKSWHVILHLVSVMQTCCVVACWSLCCKHGQVTKLIHHSHANADMIWAVIWLGQAPDWLSWSEECVYHQTKRNTTSLDCVWDITFPHPYMDMGTSHDHKDMGCLSHS